MTTARGGAAEPQEESRQGGGDRQRIRRQPWPHRMAAKWTLSMMALILAASCRQPPVSVRVPLPLDPAQLKGTVALDEVQRFLANGPRESGSAGVERAARYLMARLEHLDVPAELDEFTEVSPKGTTVYRNVIGRIPGSGNGLIVIGAHYDTKSGIPGFQGANDSGSGTGLLLALAAVLRAGRHEGPDFLIAFLDGEECRRQYSAEDGLRGSRHLARKLVSGEAACPPSEGGGRPAGKVRAVLILDMIGDRDLTVTIPRNTSPELTSAVLTAARTEGIRDKFGLFPGDLLDDHVPFLEAGMPVTNLIDFEYGSRPGRNDYWHTPNDTVDKLSAASLEAVGRVIIRTVNELAGQASGRGKG